jgi:hypothetical protein
VAASAIRPLVMCHLCESPQQCATMILEFRGDATGDGIIDLGNIIYLLNYLFKGDDAPDPLWVGDANRDGVVDLGDAVYLPNYLFKSGPEPLCWQVVP